MDYLNRYQAGEHEQVWDELMSFGTMDSTKVDYQQAVAVAHETMSRARHNIDSIVVKLNKDHYRPKPKHTLPGIKVAEEIKRMEAIVGPLPLSLRLWYELVGEVDLGGSHPKWKVRGVADAYPWELLHLRKSVNTEFLQVFGASSGNAYSKSPSTRGTGCTKVYQDDVATVVLSLDASTRGGKSADEDDELVIEGLTADAWFLCEQYRWRRETFVQYLRRSFEWGGFPGFANVPEELRPTEMLDYLRKGLLPI